MRGSSEQRRNVADAPEQAMGRIGQRQKAVMQIEKPRLVVDRLDDDGEAGDVARRATVQRVEQEEASPPPPVVAPVDRKAINAAGTSG